MVYGESNRSVMGRKKVFKMIVALALLGVLIFFNEPLGIKNLVFRLTRPLFRVAMWVNGLGLNQEEVNLREENERLRVNLFELEQLKSENLVLKKALSFKEVSKLSLKGAKVIFYSQESGKEFLIIDQGKEAGIKAGDLVIDEEQVFMGVIKEVGEGFAKVGIAVNFGETFEVEIMPLRIKALARGLGARAFSIELVALDAPLRKGDFVGLLNRDRLFLLAEISGEKTVAGSAFKEARARFLVHPELAREVFILSSGR